MSATEQVMEQANDIDNRSLKFFVMTFAITWLCLLPAALAKLGVIHSPVETFMPLALPATFGPTIAALFLSRRSQGGPGARALLRGFTLYRVSVIYYLLALLGCAAIHVAGVAVYRLLGGHDAGSLLYLPKNPERWVALIMVPLAEEPGWRGYALPRLLKRYTALRATVLLGVAWSLWHLPMFIVQGFTSSLTLIAFANIFAGTFLFTWLYLRTRGSLLLAVLAHVGSHLDNPFDAAPANVMPITIYTVAVIVVAVVMLIIERRSFIKTRG